MSNTVSFWQNRIKISIDFFSKDIFGSFKAHGMSCLRKLRSISLVGSDADAKSNATCLSKNKIHFSYPCNDPSKCTQYKVKLFPGTYKIEMCGANGGVTSNEQKNERKTSDFPYAAGCTKGIISLSQPSLFYLAIGGHGQYGKALSTGEQMPGGYNGGGNGDTYQYCSSGGGATDIRAEQNDVFHRIIVAGGGGGGDDIVSPITGNDGRGGSGGGLVAQGFYVSGTLSDFPIANQTFGYSFGQGENPVHGQNEHPFGISNRATGPFDGAGAGGGWFGGFSSSNINGGAGGGSSFVLTETAVIPTGVLDERYGNYTLKTSSNYAFSSNRKYSFIEEGFERGVWFGNGFVDITVLSVSMFCTNSRCSHRFNNIFIIVLLIYS